MDKDGKQEQPGIELASHRENVEMILGTIPHHQQLGISLYEMHDNGLTLKLPWHEKLIGYPETGVVSGGCLITLIDATLGFSVYLAVGKPLPSATLDLRLDYMRPAKVSSTIYARGECYKCTRTIAFVRGFAWDDDPDHPIMTAAGSFIMDSSKKHGKGNAA